MPAMFEKLYNRYKKKKINPILQARKYIHLLTSAIRSDDSITISRLLKRGALSNLRVNDDALSYAVSLQNSSTIRLLLQHNAFVDENSLANITQGVARVFYEHVNFRYSYSSTAALQMAVRYNDLNGVRLLLRRGANVNGRASIELSTPLHLAAKLANVDCVELLLRHDANPNLTDTRGRTPLDIVVCFYEFIHRSQFSKKREQIIEMLLDAGANANATFYNCLERILYYYNRVDSEVMEKVKLLLKYMAKMEPKQIHIYSKNMELIMGHECLKTFYMTCREEIARMLEVKIFGKLSLYDFMVKSTRAMSVYAGNNKLVNCADKFPIYHENLERRMSAARERKEALQAAATAIRLIMGNLVDEGHIVTQTILQYLSMGDLRSLIRLCKGGVDQ